MYAKTLFTVAIALIGAATSIAHAAMPQDLQASTPLTRAEVIEALLQARAAGEVQIGEQTVALRASTAPSTLTRDQVRADLEMARIAGPLHHGDRTVAPELSGPSKPRVQVLAETVEAIRLGAISRSESNTFATDAQLDSIRMAGLKAVPMTLAAR